MFKNKTVDVIETQSSAKKLYFYVRAWKDLHKKRETRWYLGVRSSKRTKKCICASKTKQSKSHNFIEGENHSFIASM